MLGRLALLVGCAVAFNAAAQGLFDDNEARRRVELLRQEFTENQRQVAEQLKKIEAALDQFKLGNYALAVSAMQGFLVTYPNSKLAPNAQYWVGMAHSGQRDYKQAIAAQRKLLAAWPDSEKAPDALLSIASSQETMGDRKSAQKTLEDVIAKYPKSSAAASAKQRLNAVRRQAP